MKPALIFAALLAAASQTPAADEGRERIAAERQVIEARYTAERNACREQFVVTACLDEAGARRRADLAPLRERELRIEDAERLARASERKAAIAARQAAAASRPASEPVARPAKAPASATPAARKAPARDKGAEQASEAVAAAERARAAQRRRQDAVQTQERIARRQAEKEAKGKKAQPLPEPASAASTSR